MFRSGWCAVAALAIGLSGLGAAACGGSRPSPDNLLLISVDTLRADRLGCYGQPRPLTPHLDRVASQGALIEQVVVPVPRTTQAIASLLTGLHPINHRARGLFSRLPEDSGRTLAQVLSDAGFETAAFTSNNFLRAGQGFERGFGIYDDPPGRWGRNGAEQIVDDALDWLARRGEARWFLWLHILDPHWPYTPAPPYDAPAGGVSREDRALFDAGWETERVHREMVFGGLPEPFAEHLRLLYDGEVTATDAAIGRLLERLTGSGLLDRTLLLVTADHGESLGDHDYWFAHGEYLYEETLRVPTLVRSPGTVPAGVRLKRLVRNFDLMPTMLDLLGVDPPAGIDGVSRIAALTGGEEDDTEREIYVESDRDLLRPGNPKRFLPGYEGSWRGLRSERWSVARIPRPGGDLWEVYDVRSDPAQETNLAGDPPAGAADLIARLESWERRAEAASGPSGPPAIDPGQERILRSLGYLAPGGDGAE